MSKTRKDNHKRDYLAIDAHFRNSAGSMKDKKLDKRINRKEARQLEKYYDQEHDEM